MTEIQILAGSSDKPSISSEGFSHSIFTAPVGSHLQKCVPKPLKDTSLWPWVGEWGPLHREGLTVQALFCFGGAHTTHAQPSGLPHQSCVGWTLALEGCGMAYSEILPARHHIEPPFLHLNTGHLSRHSALTFLCELHRPGNQILILPFAPTSSLWFYYIFCNWILHPDYHWTYITKVSSSLVLSEAIHGLHRISVIGDVLNWKFKMKKKILTCVENEPFHQF